MTCDVSSHVVEGSSSVPEPVQAGRCPHAWGVPMASACQVPHTVTLRGLPRALCKKRLYLETMFEQIGLEDALMHFRVIGMQGSSGSVEAVFTSWEAAHYCAAHFQTCAWAPQGLSVDAVVAEHKEHHSEDASVSTEAPYDTSPRSTDPSAIHEQGPSTDTPQHASLCVAYFPKTASPADLTSTFSKFGEVTLAYVMRERSGKSKCFGFVNFVEHASAVAALVACKGSFLTMHDDNGKKWYIKAEWAKKDTPNQRVPRRKQGRPGVSLSIPESHSSKSDADEELLRAEGRKLRMACLETRKLGFEKSSHHIAEAPGFRQGARWSELQSDED